MLVGGGGKAHIGGVDLLGRNAGGARIGSNWTIDWAT